ncbi:hypothetical protein DXG01_013762 [Tephrocybe rancida]|nr:hypothetical protein DXG01_013762 [Tephrocybe rancida]
MDPNFVQKLHNLLVQTISNDTIHVKAATAQLNAEFYKTPACIPALANILASSPEQPVRQLAAVELRKRISQNSGNLWITLPQNERDEIKLKLPELILAEANNLVRHSAARVVAAIATIEIPLGTWGQLLPFLSQTCTSSQVTHREVGIYILFTVLENIVEGFQEHLQSFFKLFEQLLADPQSIEVRITTVRALGVIAQYIDSDDKNDLKAFQALLPAMIQVIGQCVETSNETGARQLFDVLETLLILEVPILGKHIPELAQFLLQCGGNTNFDSELRVLALNALNWTVQYKKSKIQSNNLAPAILEGLMPIATEDEPEDLDDDAPSRSALRIIDGLATNLPPSQVFPALRTLIVRYFTSPDPKNRRGAMLALGVSVEGCSEYMTPLMSEVWPIIEAGLVDGDATVRKASCVAVSCLCEWLEDECASRHAVLIPRIMDLMTNGETQRSACTALDALLEILQDVIDQYLPLIMERLAGLLESAPLPVKAVVTGAIGSAAHASKLGFLPYFQPTMTHIQHFLVLTGEGEEIELRGITMDAIGTFAEAVGKDVFRPYFPDMMKQAFQGIEMGSARLRECSFLFFGVMARVFGEEFAPYLPNVVPALLASCNQDEHGDESISLSVADASSAFASGSSPSNAIAVADDADTSVELEDINLDKLMDVNSAIAVEKEIAADTIGTLFAACKAHFFPYVEQSALELVALLPHYYEGIRKSATDSLLEIVRTFYDLSDPQEWTPGGQSIAPLSPSVKELVGHTLVPLLEMYETEDNKSVASSLCVGLAETINKVGPAFVENHLETVCNIAIQILEQKAFCQQDPDQDETEEAPEDQAEYDSVLISSAGDLVSALAQALGADFTPAFERFFPLIAKYYKKSRSLSDRSSAIGCLAEIIAGMKDAITPTTQPLLELFYRALSDPDAEVQSNAAFAVGQLVENTQHDLAPQYIQLLGALRPLFNAAPDAPAAKLNAKDNAAGAVGRLISRNTSAIPLDQVLPIFVSALPLKNDYLENRPVFRAIFHLFQTNGAALLPFLDRLLQVFGHVLDPSQEDQVGDDIRADLIQLIGAINAEDPAKLAGRLVAQLKTTTRSPPLLFPMLLPLLTCLALVLTASASRLTVTQPPGEQLPLIARVDKPYSWSLSPHTFTSTNGPITYSASALPPWLSFDPGTMTFSGTPSHTDQGYPRIEVTAKDSSNTVSKIFTLCVTRDAEPTLNMPIAQQFSTPAPYLSSVFVMSSNTGIKTDDPALRIPPKWSFSIGFQYNTFTSSTGSLYYEARQRDGSALPGWMVFDPKAMTLNGVTPKETEISQPAVIPLSLYASDQEGYSSSSLPFVLIILANEVSFMNAIPVPINITDSFSLSLQAKILGVLVNGRPIEDSEINALAIDTSAYGWLKYDRGSRTLSGDPGNDISEQTFPLLATLEAFNQSLPVPMCLVIVPSYFTAPTLSPIQGIPGEMIEYDLQGAFSDITKQQGDEVKPTSFEPPYAQNWLSYNSGKLAGTVPKDFSGDQITVTFTAYSSVTHSTSHAKLPIVCAPPEHTKKSFHPLGLSAAAHSRLVLGLGVTFGVVGGLCLIGGLLAAIRRCARVEDTAVGGEEGRNVWSDRDKKWYGAGWSDRDPNFTEKPNLSLDRRASFDVPNGTHNQAYEDLGLGLRRVSERSHSQGSNQSPGVMSKREFFTRLRETVRVVSDKVQGRKVSRQRPVIGKPILPHAQERSEPPMIPSSSTFFEQAGLTSHPGSTIMTNSPSASTAEHSIPRRRADFAPPRLPAPAHTRLSRQLSSGSSASDTSERIHASEAVVQIASKAMSIHSGRSVSGRSFITEPPLAAATRPRLVPFTSASRVPVPHRPASPPGLQRDGGSSSKRVNSQSAKVWRREPKGGAPKESSDELKMGLHYVQSLGADPQSSP